MRRPSRRRARVSERRWSARRWGISRRGRSWRRVAGNGETRPGTARKGDRGSEGPARNGALAASATTGPRQPLLGLMNALVERNGFGRQVHSFEKELEIEGFEEPFVGVFIRAPFFEDVGPGVEVLGKVDGRIVAARGENILVTAFHPELTDDTRFHEYFVREVCGL